MEAVQRFKQDLNLCFSIFKGIFTSSVLFRRLVRAEIRRNRRKIFHKVMGVGLLVFTKPMTGTLFVLNEEKAIQKDQFLRETERQLCMAQVEATLEADDLIHASWNGKPLCTVANGPVRFSPDDIRGAGEDRLLQTVTQTVAQVKEYLRIMERAPTLKAIDLDEDYKILAEFDDTVLAGRMSKKGVRFVTWEYDFDRRGVHAGHYFMQNYEGAKQDFAARAGLVNHQRLFSDEQLGVIRNACALSLEDNATLSYAEEKQLHSVQEQIELLLPQQERNQHPTMEQTM